MLKILGILIGRYPGDVYAGGNPWQLLTAATAEFFYLGGHATLDKIRSEGIYYLNEIDNKRWLDLLNVRLNSTIPKLGPYLELSSDFSYTLEHRQMNLQ